MRNYFDIHCHFVPGVDDGAGSMEEALALLKLEYTEGVRNIIVTPHYRVGMFETPADVVKQQFERLKEEAAKAIPDAGFNLYYGREFHRNMDMTDTLREHPEFTMAGSSYLLLEFSGADSPRTVKERTYAALSHGYIPIIAHVERYPRVRSDFHFLEELHGMGAFLQVNADTILGNDGWGMKRFAKKLIREDLLDFVGSDGHNISDRKPRMGDCAAYLERKYGEEYAERILIRNPQCILDDERV